MDSSFGFEALTGAWQQCHGSHAFRSPLVQTKVSSPFSVGCVSLAVMGQMSTWAENNSHGTGFSEPHPCIMILHNAIAVHPEHHMSS
jgi:hypothetical protein